LAVWVTVVVVVEELLSWANAAPVIMANAATPVSK